MAANENRKRESFVLYNEKGTWLVLLCDLCNDIVEIRIDPDEILEISF